jgi:hypothetical protein
VCSWNSEGKGGGHSGGASGLGEMFEDLMRYPTPCKSPSLTCMPPACDLRPLALALALFSFTCLRRLLVLQAMDFEMLSSHKIVAAKS